MRLACTILAGLTAVCAAQVTENVNINRSLSGRTIEFSLQSQSGNHYILYRSLTLQETGEPIDVKLSKSQGEMVLLKDRFRPDPVQAYYRVETVPNGESGDLDGDGVSDWAEMSTANTGSPWSSLPKSDHLQGTTDTLTE